MRTNRLVEQIPERDPNIFEKLIMYDKDNISNCQRKDGIFLYTNNVEAIGYLLRERIMTLDPYYTPGIKILVYLDKPNI